MDRQLDGRTALVTGASAGIGSGIALALAREGARLAIAGRNEAALRALAFELAPSGITVNCVAPGRIDSEQVRE